MQSAIQIIESITMILVLKVLITTLLLVYVIFAFLMMKQVSAMTRAVTMKDDFVVRGLSLIHFVFAVLVLLLALVIL